MTSWARIVGKLIGLTFSIKGVEKVVPGVSYIVTPNHQGHTDILALLNTLPVRFRWVVKKELLKIPIFGWALARTGAIALDRSKGREAMDKLRQQKDKLQNGWGVLVYPEGTRTSDGQLQSFKRGAFVMAVHLNVPILPVTTNGAFKVLPRDTIEFRPGHVSVTIGDPIDVQGLTVDDIPELMDKTRNAILKNLDVDYNPFNSQGNH
jgi:1-acyl-sn-glycerol-3-phosphate acyltransferase